MAPGDQYILTSVFSELKILSHLLCRIKEESIPVIVQEDVVHRPDRTPERFSVGCPG